MTYPAQLADSSEQTAEGLVNLAERALDGGTAQDNIEMAKVYALLAISRRLEAVSTQLAVLDGTIDNLVAVAGKER